MKIAKKQAKADGQLMTADALKLNLDEVKGQLAQYGEMLEKIVDKLEDVPAGAAVDAFRTQVIRKQLYLENLLDETTSELDLLKRDVRSVASDLEEVKASLYQIRHGDAVTVGKVQEERDDTAAPTTAANEDNEMLNVMRQHPLSSIPPRQLSENEAMSFLKAIDEIITKRRISDFPAPFVSEK